MSRLVLLAIVVGLIPGLASGDDSAGGLGTRTNGGALLPAGATPVEYSVVYVFERHTASSGSRRADLGGASGSGKQTEIVGPVFDGQLIDSEEAYGRAFRTPPAKIDWKTSRIYAVEETTTYRLGRIDSRTSLGGVYRYGDTLYVSVTSTHLGPCQGIAQLPEWFSHDSRILFLKIPRTPEKIIAAHEMVGGCPPDIP